MLIVHTLRSDKNGTLFFVVFLPEICKPSLAKKNTRQIRIARHLQNAEPVLLKLDSYQKQRK